MALITVAQRKGGAGKTTIAVSLAAEIASRQKEIALIDSDPQRSSCHWAATGNLTFPVYEIPLLEGSVRSWATTVRRIEARHAIIDTAPSEHSVGASIALADIILVPCTPSGLDLEATAETLAIIRAVRERRRTPAEVVIVPNRVDVRTLEGRQLIDALRELGEAVAPPVSSRSAFVRSFSEGTTVCEMAGAQAARREIENICDLVQTVLRSAGHPL